MKRSTARSCLQLRQVCDDRNLMYDRTESVLVFKQVNFLPLTRHVSLYFSPGVHSMMSSPLRADETKSTALFSICSAEDVKSFWVLDVVSDQLQRFPGVDFLAKGVRDGIRLPLPMGLALGPAPTDHVCFSLVSATALPGHMNT